VPFSRPPTWANNRSPDHNGRGDNGRDAYRQQPPNIPDNRNREGNRDGNRNHDGDNNRGGNQVPDWNRNSGGRDNGGRDSDRTYPPKTRDNRDREWNRARNRAPDKAYRYDGRHDRRPHRDDWWTHHRYAKKGSIHNGSGRSVHWRVEWTKPYRGKYFDIWRYVPLITAAIRLKSPPPLLGSAIIAYDNTFLGLISRDWQNPDSISNPYDRFGCPEAPWSIWNPDGRWGSEYSFDSPWNPSGTHPPRVYNGNYFLGYLTTNNNLYPRIDPYWLMDYLDIWVRD